MAATCSYQVRHTGHLKCKNQYTRTCHPRFAMSSTKRRAFCVFLRTSYVRIFIGAMPALSRISGGYALAVCGRRWRCGCALRWCQSFAGGCVYGAPAGGSDMRWLFRIAIHAVVFGLLYRVARDHGLHGEAPYVVAALATGLLARLLYRRRRWMRW